MSNKKQTNRRTAPFDFNPFLPKTSRILVKLIMFKKLEFKPIFGDPPMAALRHPSILKKVVSWSKLYPKSRADKYSHTHKRLERVQQLAALLHFHQQQK